MFITRRGQCTLESTAASSGLAFELGHWTTTPQQRWCVGNISAAQRKHPGRHSNSSREASPSAFLNGRWVSCGAVPSRELCRKQVQPATPSALRPDCASYIQHCMLHLHVVLLHALAPGHLESSMRAASATRSTGLMSTTRCARCSKHVEQQCRQQLQRCNPVCRQNGGVQSGWVVPPPLPSPAAEHHRLLPQ